MRGGERCLEVFCELFPEADLFTLLHVPGSVSETIERRRITTSFIQNMPGAAQRYRQYLPLFPAAVRRFDLRGYDLVLSSSHAVAKGARVPPGALHVCYCFTPMRYVWDLYDEYFGPRAGLQLLDLDPRCVDVCLGGREICGRGAGLLLGEISLERGEIGLLGKQVTA